MVKDKIINFCPTGVIPTRQNSKAPLSVNEIVDEVCEMYAEKLITLVHLHARDKSDNNTYKASVYFKILDGIRKYCPDLSICVSLSGRLFPDFEKRSEPLELYPDMASLTMSSLNFPQSASVNEPDIIIRLIEKMEKYEVIPEIECFDSGMLNYTNYLIKRCILTPPYYVNIIFGNIYNAQCDPSSISTILQNKPVNSKMCFGGIGKQQLNANILGLLYADGIRIGLEDNLYYVDKELATNKQLLKRIKVIMDEMDMKIMSPKSFKDLGYANKINTDRKK